jgi:hypothetical protein
MRPNSLPAIRAPIRTYFHPNGARSTRRFDRAGHQGTDADLLRASVRCCGRWCSRTCPRGVVRHLRLNANAGYKLVHNARRALGASARASWRTKLHGSVRIAPAGRVSIKAAPIFTYPLCALFAFPARTECSQDIVHHAATGLNDPSARTLRCAVGRGSAGHQPTYPCARPAPGVDECDGALLRRWPGHHRRYHSWIVRVLRHSVGRSAAAGTIAGRAGLACMPGAESSQRAISPRKACVLNQVLFFEVVSGSADLTARSLVRQERHR